MRDRKSLLAAETFLSDYPEVSKSAVRVGVGFPNTYSVGMASLGYQLVWHMFRSSNDISVFRFFLPENDIPVTLEDGLPLKALDVLCFSVAFEMDYLNLLSILKNSQIPLESKDRGENDPIILIGGPVTLINPQPLYDFADALYIGDLESNAGAVCSILAQKREGRQHVLHRLSQFDCITVPSLNKFGVRSVEHNLDAYISHSVICTPNAEFGDTLLIETARGCGRGCRFCAAGNTTKPMRLRKPKLPEYKSYGIVGAAVFDNPNTVSLCSEIVNNGASFSLSSLRLETLTEEKLKLMKAGKVHTVTIAPEAGTERLRKVIGKTCSHASILNAVHLVAEAGFLRIKFYFMIGLPEETDDDLMGIISLLEEVHSLYPNIRVSASVGVFVPKPRTPFADIPQPSEKEINRRLSLMKKHYVRGVEINFESARLARVQWILAGADSVNGKAFLKESLKNGYRSGLRLLKDK